MKSTKRKMEIEFNEDKTTLIKYPKNLKSESYIIPDSLSCAIKRKRGNEQ
jgi:hypothetical protein